MRFPWFRRHKPIVRKYGRLPAVRPNLRDVNEYGVLLAAAPASVAVPNVSNWGMLGNDGYGCCGPAGFIHGCMACAVLTREHIHVPTAQVLVNAYLAYTGGQDSGVVLSDFLTHVHQHGFCGHTDVAFAPFKTSDIDTLKRVVNEFGFAYVGITVYQGMEDACQGDPSTWQPWTADLVSGQVAGGHCVIIVGYDADWLYIVTWGQVVKVAWDAWALMADEAFAVITGEVAAHNGDGRGHNLKQLEADNQALAAAA